MYVAHIVNDKDGIREQTVKEHCENVAYLAAEKAKICGLESTLRVVGLLHDIGKNHRESDEYQRAVANDLKAVRGSVHHSKAGARLVYENFYNDYELASKTIAVAIASHHGIFDVVSPTGTNRFYEKMKSEESCNYKECVEKTTA